MHSDAAERYLSQSEVSDWNQCPLKAHARWILGHRPPDDESRPQRIGSMAHAIFADRVEADIDGAFRTPHVAVRREAEKRGWVGDLDDDMHLAASAVDRLVESGCIDSRPEFIVRHDGHPLVEVRLRAKWWDGIFPDFDRLVAVPRRFAGIEGQMDLVTAPEGMDGAVVIDDYKFRQSPDLGGADGAAGSRLPDRQFAWYAVLLWASGIHPRGGFEAHQVNVYAGRWLSVDDFMDAAAGRSESPEMAALVTSSGLPTIDMNRYKKAGGWVSAATWAEAHRLLAEDRLSRRLDEWRRPKFTPKGQPRKQGEPPDRLSSAEQYDANRFLTDLESYRPVVVRTFRADLSVCMEVVRDMIVSVDGPLSQSLRGLAPARMLQTWPKSACVKPYGCSYQGPCHASLGSGRVLEVLTELRAQAERRDAEDDPLWKIRTAQALAQVLAHAAPGLAPARTGWPRPGQFTHDDPIGPDCFGGSDDLGVLEDNATLSLCDEDGPEA